MYFKPQDYLLLLQVVNRVTVTYFICLAVDELRRVLEDGDCGVEGIDGVVELL